MGQPRGRVQVDLTPARGGEGRTGVSRVVGRLPKTGG